jgi:ankyrin repeat protein
MDEAWDEILSGKDHGDELRLLLGSKDKNPRSKAFTLLHKVVLGMMYFNLNQLLEASCADIDQHDVDGKTPLAWAAIRRDHHNLNYTAFASRRHRQ